MNFLGRVFESIMDSYGNPAITTVTLLSMLSIVFLLAVYEYFIYRVVSHRAFYSRAFNITIAVLPFFYFYDYIVSSIQFGNNPGNNRSTCNHSI